MTFTTGCRLFLPDIPRDEEGCAGEARGFIGQLKELLHHRREASSVLPDKPGVTEIQTTDPYPEEAQTDKKAYCEA